VSRSAKPAISATALIPGLLVSGAAVAALLLLVDFDRTFQALGSANPGAIAIATAVFAVGLTGRAAASRELVDRRTGLGGAFAALNIGYLANNLLPLRVGEVVRSVVLGRKTGTGFVGGATAVGAERLLDLIMAATVLIAGISAVGIETAWVPAAAAAAAATAGISALVVIARRRSEITAWLEPKVAGRPRLASLLPKLSSALEGLARPQRLLGASAILGASWAVAVVCFWIVLRAFIPTAPMGWASFGLGAMAFGIALPSSPGAIGVYEAVWVGALALCGADPAAALAFAVSVHALTFTLTSVCGLVALILEVPRGAGFAGRAASILRGRDPSTEEEPAR